MEEINRWSTYKKMKKQNEIAHIIINKWTDYFKFINEKLNIKFSKNMEKQLIQYENDFQIENEYLKYKQNNLF